MEGYYQCEILSYGTAVMLICQMKQGHDWIEGTDWRSLIRAYSFYE